MPGAGPGGRCALTSDGALALQAEDGMRSVCAEEHPIGSCVSWRKCNNRGEAHYRSVALVMTKQLSHQTPWLSDPHPDPNHPRTTSGARHNVPYTVAVRTRSFLAAPG